MKPFTDFQSRIVPLPLNNIDTDQIIPAGWLKLSTTDPEERKLYGRYAMSGAAFGQAPPTHSGLAPSYRVASGRTASVAAGVKTVALLGICHPA